ncbi:hypothetical protein [Engelhardtia mirabilis]|uniref:Uncharacterized protein n=1 Tax=Engelhardtia mirabilis TaxID=2528011 RepID=A0A518BGU4_9BACT|nr:hypothetical protein Pla133_12610 [Planctomycetes bacterium Pla133]QDV00522.1 hypothetical protein Pla86_12610 [Planctomycetes bacterium Pla86]
MKTIIRLAALLATSTLLLGNAQAVQSCEPALIVSAIPTGNCCFDFALSQSCGGGGDFVTITATVLTPGANLTAASNSWVPAPTFGSKQASWTMESDFGPVAGKTVSACFQWSASNKILVRFQALGNGGGVWYFGTFDVELTLPLSCHFLSTMEISGLPCANYLGTPMEVSGKGTTESGSGTFEVVLDGAPAFSPAFMMLGTTDQWLGLPLPLELTAFAGPAFQGCTLYQSAILITPTVSDASGHAALSIPIPADPNLIGKSVGAQWLGFDLASQLPGMSALGTILIGAPQP